MDLTKEESEIKRGLGSTEDGGSQDAAAQAHLLLAIPMDRWIFRVSGTRSTDVDVQANL